MTTPTFLDTWSRMPGPIELLEEGAAVDDITELVGRAPGATRAMTGQGRERLQRLTDRLRGLRRDEVVADGVPTWIDLIELHVPPAGSAQLKRSHSATRTITPKLSLFGFGFGSGVTVSFGESVTFDAHQAGKVLQVRLLVTATRYVDRGGGSVMRVDVSDPPAGVEHRIAVTSPESLESFDRTRWTLLRRADLSAAGEEGQYSWTYTAGRHAQWNVGLDLAGFGPLPLQASFQAEVEDSDEFETSFELPYGIDVIFYHRRGETPLAPRCGTTPAEMAELAFLVCPGREVRPYCLRVETWAGSLAPRTVGKPTMPGQIAYQLARFWL